MSSNLPTIPRLTCRLSLAIALLLVSISTVMAQGNPLANVVNGPCPGTGNPAATYVPVFVNPGTICNSVVHQLNLGPTSTVGVAAAPTSDIGLNLGGVATYGISDQIVLSLNGGNVLVGPHAGTFNTGGGNTMVGHSAGAVTAIGFNNVFLGDFAGFTDDGSDNVAIGVEAGYLANANSRNVYIGRRAGYGQVAGTSNVFIGYFAGHLNRAGDNNIYISNIGTGTDDDGGESNSIHIGTQGTHNVAYVAGIYPTGVANNNPVCVTAKGQLGVCGSSQRFKDDVRDMEDPSANLMLLRPVTYVYKSGYQSGELSRQFGLIAEEVEEIYPGLVSHGPQGEALTVNYQALTAVLLKELQNQRSTITQQRQQIETLQSQLNLQNASIQQRLSRLESLQSTQAVSAEAPASSPVTPGGGGLH